MQERKLKSALRRGNVVLSDGKLQILGLTKKVRAVWELVGDNSTPVAKD